MTKRLVRKAFMDIEVLKSTMEQLSDEGRRILRSIEDYKFKLEQASRIVSADQMLAQKINQKQKILDTAAGQIYGIVFDIENIDITQTYTQEQLMVTNPGMGQVPDGEATPTPMPGQPGQPTVPRTPTDSDDDSAPAGGGGAPIPQGGSVAPSPEDEDEDEDDSGSDNKDKDTSKSKDTSKGKDNKKDDSKDDEDLKEQELPEEPKK